MSNEEENLRLIYVLKIGYNANGEGLYEFIFSLDPTNIAFEDWCWDLSPACDYAEPPTEKYYNKIVPLKTKSFDLFCLHEAVDREYMHGYHTIHALAYETERDEDNINDYDSMFSGDSDDDDMPLLVFHYGMTLLSVKDILSSKKIVLRDNGFIETSSIKFK